MKVYSEYQVKELLRQQRENCVKAVKMHATQPAGQSDLTIDEKVETAKEPLLRPSVEVYFKQDMKRSFMEGFGAGFDACVAHWGEDSHNDKLKAFNDLNDFDRWFTEYKLRKNGSAEAYHNENIISK